MIFIINILILFSLSHGRIVHDLNDYKSHPCIRDCSKSTTQMECKYFFTVEWYMTLSKACFDCPNITNNCDRPHCISANGIQRVVISVNRMIPGPQIQACQNDIINVIVHNNLRMAESTTIHWHGIMQKGTPHMDGVGMVTQCPIDPHTSFEYKFIARDAGTMFWHAHIGIQRGDGIFGALVIKPKNDVHADKYDFDLNEHIIILNDWFDNTIIARFTFSAHNIRNSSPDSILINGKGINIRNITATQTPRAIFKVKHGYRYRFRIIDAGNLFCPMQFLVDQHELTVISTDGTPVEASNFEAVVLNAAERVDIIINANRRPGNYWIKVKGLGSCESAKIYQTAILNYEGVPVEEPFDEVTYNSIRVFGKQLNNEVISANDSFALSNSVHIDQLKGIPENPLIDYYNQIKRTPDRKFYFGIGFNKVNNPEFNDPLLYPIRIVPVDKQFATPQINRISHEMPPSPLLSQFNDVPRSMMCNERNVENFCSRNKTICTCIHLVEVALNDLVEFIFVDENRGFFSPPIKVVHPMHVHGHKFAVIGLDTPPATDRFTVEDVQKLDIEGRIKRNFNRPPVKDTIGLPANGYTVIRFIADNPGVWMVHCHIDFHMETGMTFLLKVGDVSEFPKEPPNWPKCGSFRLH